MMNNSFKKFSKESTLVSIANMVKKTRKEYGLSYQELVVMLEDETTVEHVKQIDSTNVECTTIWFMNFCKKFNIDPRKVWKNRQ